MHLPNTPSHTSGLALPKCAATFLTNASCCPSCRPNTSRQNTLACTKSSSVTSLAYSATDPAAQTSCSLMRPNLPPPPTREAEEKDDTRGCGCGGGGGRT